MTDFVDSASDDRTVNNVARHEYRVLDDADKAAVKWIKDSGAAFIGYCNELKAGGIAPREMSLAVTKMEEAVFWAVKGIMA